MSTDDHPVRTIFIEAVASRLKMTVEDARKFVAPITTEAMDTYWPIEEVAEQHEKGDLVATFYPKKGLHITQGIH